MAKRMYSTELKIEIVQKYLQGTVGAKQLAQKYPAAARHWHSQQDIKDPRSLKMKPGAEMFSARLLAYLFFLLLYHQHIRAQIKFYHKRFKEIPP